MYFFTFITTNFYAQQASLDVNTVSPFHLQWEPLVQTGWGENYESFTFPYSLMRFGLFKNLEMRIENTKEYVVEKYNRPQTFYSENSKWDAGIKIKLNDRSNYHSSLTTMWYLHGFSALPDITSTHFFQLNKFIAWDLNIGGEIIKAKPSYLFIAHYSTGIVFNVHPDWDLYVEIYDDHVYPYIHVNLNLGFTYQIREDFGLEKENQRNFSLNTSGFSTGISWQII